MNLTAQNSKSEPASELVAEFSRELAGESAEAIQWAFRQWRRESPFWPAVSDIRAHVATWKRLHRENQAEIAARQEKMRIEVARGKGQLLDFGDVARKLKEKAEASEFPEVERRRRDFERARPIHATDTPPIHLTKEQIDARREQELAEIQKAVGDSE